jgi:hypothetical protein
MGDGRFVPQNLPASLFNDKGENVNEIILKGK